MYLHIGSDIEIPIKNIIAILDIKTSKNKINTDFLSKVDKTIKVSSKVAKTIILVETNNKKNIYTLFVSPISSQTLKKRIS